MLKKFLSYYKPYKSILFLNLSFALIVALIDLVFPLISRKIFNIYLPDYNIELILIMGAILLACILVRLVLTFCRSNQVLGILIERDVRQELFAQVEKMDYNFFNENKTGKLLTSLTSTLGDIGDAAYAAPENILIFLIMFSGSFVILLTIDILLTIIIFTTMIGVFTFSLWRGRKTFKAKRDIRNATSEMNAEIEKSLNSIMLTKTFNNESYEIEKFNDKSDVYEKSMTKSARQLSVYSSVNTFMLEICNIVLLIVGSFFIINDVGSLTIVDLVTYFFYINILVKYVGTLLTSFQQIQDGITGFEKFYDLMTIKAKIKSKRGSKKITNLDGEILFNDVNFSYAETSGKTLENFSLSVKPGSTIGIVGKTGSGKSTISKLIPRFYDVDSGEILIDGINIKDYNIKSLRNSIGVVQQDVHIFWGTIKENILYGRPKSKFSIVIEAAKKARLHDFIMSLPDGYNTFVGEKGYKLSGGQKQKISIARLFLKNPRIIILDEATSSLDNDTEKNIMADFEELFAGRTTIIIAHRLAAIINCTEIIVMDEGKIVERGCHQTLLELNGYYSKLFHLDN